MAISHDLLCIVTAATKAGYSANGKATHRRDMPDNLAVAHRKWQDRHRNEYQNAPDQPCRPIGVMAIFRFLLVYRHQIPPGLYQIAPVMCAW